MYKMNFILLYFRFEIESIFIASYNVILMFPRGNILIENFSFLLMFHLHFTCIFMKRKHDGIKRN